MPTAVQSFPNDIAIDAGNDSDVNVMSDGTVWGWGRRRKEHDLDDRQRLPVLRNVVQKLEDGNRNFVALEQRGSNPSCATSSSVYTWAADHGPQDVPQLDCKNVVQLASAAGHVTALTATGQVYVWGGGRAALGPGPGVNSEMVPTLAPAITALTGGTSKGVHITAGMTTGGILVNGRAYS